MAPLLGGRETITRQGENTEQLCRRLADNSLDAQRFLEEAKRRVREAPSAVEQFTPGADGISKSPLQYHPIGFFSEDMFDDAGSVKDWAAATLDSVADMAAVHERLRTFEGPVLLVLGTHDAMLAYEGARRLAATMRRAILATVHGGNHYFLVEHGRTVASLLRTFLLKGSVGDVHPSIRHGARVRVHSTDPCCANGS
jgi:pimeloyl-ACP methyl ester carboxylesterase